MPGKYYVFSIAQKAKRKTMYDLSKYATPVRENEIPKVLEIDTKALIDKHQEKIEILEAISLYKIHLNTAKEQIAGAAGSFTTFRAQYIHKIHIYSKVIERLYERYQKA